MSDDYPLRWRALGRPGGHNEPGHVPPRGVADQVAVVYLLIGVLAVRIALGPGGGQADRKGALHQVAAQPYGNVMLWALVVGFGCMAIWRGARALIAKGGRRKAGARLLDGGRAIFYAAVCWTRRSAASPTPRRVRGYWSRSRWD
jgi:hypothetical protein